MNRRFATHPGRSHIELRIAPSAPYLATSQNQSLYRARLDYMPSPLQESANVAKQTISPKIHPKRLSVMYLRTVDIGIEAWL